MEMDLGEGITSLERQQGSHLASLGCGDLGCHGGGST